MLFQYLFDCSFQYAIAVQQAHNVWMRHGELFDTYWIWVLLTWVDQIHQGEIFFFFSKWYSLCRTILFLLIDCVF